MGHRAQEVTLRFTLNQRVVRLQRPEYPYCEDVWLARVIAVSGDAYDVRYADGNVDRNLPASMLKDVRAFLPTPVAELQKVRPRSSNSVFWKVGF